MRIIRFLEENGLTRLAAITDENLLYELPFENILELRKEAQQRKASMVEIIQQAIQDTLPKKEEIEQLKLLVPIEAQEVWAAGVTYLRSREERNYEATGGKHTEPTIYDKVYEAKRPEIFFKSTKDRTRGTGDSLCLRTDSNWQVPEPELALVLDQNGQIFGFTIGNDLSCRDIEGENPLYLPQAKIWKNSCSIGPAIRLAETVEDFYSFQITCRIYRNQEKIFEETSHTRDLRRTYEELCSYLVKDNIVFNGTVLLTGTSIVPPESYTLQDGDLIEIEIPGIGTLVNPVKEQAVKIVETI